MVEADTTCCFVANRGAVCCIGGPALVYYVQPTDEELFKRYNPELQKKSLNRRYERQKEFDDFVTQLKTDSKDDRHSMRHPTIFLSLSLPASAHWITRNWLANQRLVN